ncbi:MAG: hypothetical protein ISN29_06655 [Gammaproteobacteria bacterium AqS3]|nr:hypothetical protein [Gammaproteobacteria bacterium AqS3]
MRYHVRLYWEEVGLFMTMKKYNTKKYAIRFSEDLEKEFPNLIGEVVDAEHHRYKDRWEPMIIKEWGLK